MLRGIKFSGGYRHLSHSNGTKVYEPTDSTAWEIETREFRKWCDREDSCISPLFCYGNPGAGKTYIMGRFTY